MKAQFGSGNKLGIILHVVVWTVLLAVVTYMLYGGSPHDLRFMKEIWFQFCCYAVIFYLSYLLLAPKYFFTRKKTRYFLITGALILAFTLLLALIRAPHPGNPWQPAMPSEPALSGPLKHFPEGRPPLPVKSWPLFNFVLTSCLVAGFSLGLRFSEKLIQNEKLRKEAEKEKLRTELAFLKQQINPHFLFNTLNSIYSLALVKSDLTAEAVMKLSDMMRYVIQEAGHEMVPLDLELEYVKHYVGLQKMRLSTNVDVQMNIASGSQPYLVPPMILFPFVENAFKHGTSSHENAVIQISLEIREGMLVWMVKNRLFSGREKPETFGIGLRNTRKRLELLYPGKHSLETRATGNDFIAELRIPLA